MVFLKRSSFFSLKDEGDQDDFKRHKRKEKEDTKTETGATQSQ